MRKFDEKHEEKSMVLKVVGPILLIAGVIMFASLFFSIAKSATSMHMGFNETNFNSPFKMMPLGFIGVILIGIGGAITNFAYMGSVARYTSDELTPVATKVIKNVKDGLKDDVIHCKHCQEENDSDAKFCDHCGKSFSDYICSCGVKNDQDAKFCKACGQVI